MYFPGEKLFPAKEHNEHRYNHTGVRQGCRFNFNIDRDLIASARPPPYTHRVLRHYWYGHVATVQTQIYALDLN